MSTSRNWTVHLVRTDGLESHTLRMGRGRVVLFVTLASLALLAAGLGLGLAWAAREESTTVAELRSEVARQRADRARLAELAARLGEMEERYGRLQAAVTAGVPEATPLPPVPFETGLVSRRDAASQDPAWPLAGDGFLTRSFGSRGDASGDGHTGVDIAAPTGSYVRAILPGVVEEAGQDEIYGNFVRIAHADGLASLYGHNSWLFAAPGDSVDRLQVIALSGNTGRSTAPHLHLELTENGSLVDPLAYVAEEPGRTGVPPTPDAQPR